MKTGCSMQLHRYSKKVINQRKKDAKIRKAIKAKKLKMRKKDYVYQDYLWSILEKGEK